MPEKYNFDKNTECPLFFLSKYLKQRKKCGMIKKIFTFWKDELDMEMKIGVIKGDGIGPEIVDEAMKVLDQTAKFMVILFPTRSF